MKDSLNLKITTEFYENSYKKLGLDAQRKYPNEELCLNSWVLCLTSSCIFLGNQNILNSSSTAILL